MKLRDHEPIVISEFNGLWNRGNDDDVPLDHFADCDNIQFRGDKSFSTRDGIGISQTVAVPLSNVKRIYNYPTPTGNTLIVLVMDDTEGQIFHVVNPTTVFGPILSIEGMTDFAFVPWAGRAYISPFSSFLIGSLFVEKGLENEKLYVYMGDGTAARPAGIIAPLGALVITNGAVGNTDAGFHLFGVVNETDTGALSEVGAITGGTTSSALAINFASVPVSPDSNVVKRHIVATKVITGYNGNTTGYQFYFIPTGTIEDNVTTTLFNISFFDADLLADASYLFDNYTTIPAGAVLTLYHQRLCLSTTFNDISLILVSHPGEPESISQIDGLIVAPLDGNPITNLQELRDVFYVFKRSKTISYTDNGDVPSTWPLVTVDNALGTSVHGIATVLDSGSSSVDSLIICTYQGISLFNGRYIEPELSWKIDNYWRQLDRNEFRKIQIINAPIQKEIMTVLPDRTLLRGNYGNGFNLKKIRWAPNSFLMGINTIAIWNIDEIILGADLG